VTALLLAAVLAAAPCAAADDPELPRPTARAICSLSERTTATLEADRARLEDIYARERYALARTSNSGALKALYDRLMAWLFSLFESRGAQSFSQVTRFVVLTLAALLAAIGALRLLGRWRNSGAPAHLESKSATALILDSPQEHLARARAALTRAPREAIREGLLALLSSLEDARLARPDRVRTNRELVRELPARGADSALVSRVEPLMRWYDGAFYSLEPVPSEGAARFVDDVEKLSGELSRGPR
jgi:hypothetical protein